MIENLDLTAVDDCSLLIRNPAISKSETMCGMMGGKWSVGF